VYIEMMQEGLNIKCSFQDFVTVDKMCIDVMHTDEFCNQSPEVENTGEVNEESGFRLVSYNWPIMICALLIFL